MEKFYKAEKSRNDTNMILKNISSHTSESYFDNNYFLNHHKNYFNYKQQNSLIISTDKIMNGSTLNNNDINYRRDSALINKKSKIKIISIRIVYTILDLIIFFYQKSFFIY